MWERIGASSGIVIGAFVLFALFALALFIMEKDEILKKRSNSKRLCVVPKVQSRQSTCTRLQRNVRRPAADCVYNDMKLRKIS